MVREEWRIEMKLQGQKYTYTWELCVEINVDGGNYRR